MNLAPSDNLVNNQNYTFWFNITGALPLNSGYIPTGTEITDALIPFMDLGNITSQVYQDPTGTVGTGVAVSFTFIGNQDNVADMGNKIASALSSAFYTSNYSFDHATTGVNAPTQASTFWQSLQDIFSLSTGNKVVAIFVFFIVLMILLVYFFPGQLAKILKTV